MGSRLRCIERRVGRVTFLRVGVLDEMGECEDLRAWTIGMVERVVRLHVCLGRFVRKDRVRVRDAIVGDVRVYC